jgi:arylformamidase
MKIIDISPTISEKTAVWPGDLKFSRDVSLSISGGNNIDLSSIRSTVHIGAHADAPSHFAASSKSIDQVDLAPYVGPCQVVRVQVARGERILAKDLKTAVQAPRVLFKTDSFPDPDYFNEDFCSLSAELILYLAKHACVLVGIDTPSIDPYDDKVLESHQALVTTGIRNLEGLVLTHVPEGLYELVALPLKIEKADASPVRAVLLKS